MLFSLYVFGKHHALQDVELDGSAKYGRVVSQLRRSLSNPSAPGFAALLVPVLILLMHASSTATHRDEARVHAMGMFHLLRACGSEPFRHEPLRAAFSSCRATLVTISLLTETRLFLERQDWQGIPWSCDPASKSEQDRLVDILVMVPGFLEDRRRLSDCADSSACEELANRVSYQLQLLYHWRWEWGRKYPLAAWEEERQPPLPHSPEILYPEETTQLLRFVSFARAVEISLYNAVLLHLLQLLCSLASATEAHLPVSRTIARARSNISLGGSLRPPQGIPSQHEAAIEIARAFEYQLLHVRQSKDSALFWLYPLGQASKILGGEVEWNRWIQQMLNASRVTRGYGSGNNPFGFGFYL